MNIDEFKTVILNEHLIVVFGNKVFHQMTSVNVDCSCNDICKRHLRRRSRQLFLLIFDEEVVESECVEIAFSGQKLPEDLFAFCLAPVGDPAEALHAQPLGLVGEVESDGEELVPGPERLEE